MYKKCDEQMCKTKGHHLKTNTNIYGEMDEANIGPSARGSEEIKQNHIFEVLEIVSQTQNWKEKYIPKQLMYRIVTNKCKNKRTFIYEFIISTGSGGSTEERGGLF